VHNRTSTLTTFKDLLASADPLALLALLATAVIAIMIVLFLITVWYGKDIVSFAKHYILTKRLPSQHMGDVVEYVYPGVKLVLRKYYLKLRDALGCRKCTPRELLTRYGRSEYEDFVQLYEDVVYGSKELSPEGKEVLVKLDVSI
ncbi:MAG: DUF4129 domain-containing protein, partial [Nitrososphaerota archaeon]